MKLISFILIFILVGCAATIFPVCNKDTAGTLLKGKECVMSDGTYRWVDISNKWTEPMRKEK